MKIITWNLNSRTNKRDLENQCNYLLAGKFDIITLQEVLLASQDFFKNFFRGMHSVSSFDLVEDKYVLERNRKIGQLIISKNPIDLLERCNEIPFPERVLSGKTGNMEVHTTHVPPGSSNGVIKVKHFEGLYNYLSRRKDSLKLLTGDFNSPKLELRDGEIITWGQKLGRSGKPRIAINPKWKHQCTGERWDAAERSIIENHTSLGMKDAFREKNDYEELSGSWFTNQGQGRRYDHIFASHQIDIENSFYDHQPRVNKLSDHSPLIVELSIR